LLEVRVKCGVLYSRANKTQKKREKPGENLTICFSMKQNLRVFVQRETSKRLYKVSSQCL